MRGFLLLEPDDATSARLHALQNRLQGSLARQGVHFPERLGATILAWPFATPDQLLEAAERPIDVPADFQLGSLEGRPNGDRPAEIGFSLTGGERLQAGLYAEMKTLLDPDPPKPPFVRLVRISPPSRKIGSALRASGLLGQEGGGFGVLGLTIWNQSPTGFERCRTMRCNHGGA